MTPAGTAAASELVEFVRGILGCGCPQEIVARTTIDRGETGEIGLDVGGRLLVRVLASEDLDRLIDVFPETVERLRAERDRRGFNRLRLVVAHDRTDLVADVLAPMLRLIPAADDRVHLHVIRPDQLPATLHAAAASP